MTDRTANTGARPLLVGETNPYGADPYFALYPLPVGASGDRLCRLVMGLDMGNYLRAYDRVNLCTGKWSLCEARRRADELREPGSRTLVLLGAKVAKAFSAKPGPFTYVGRGNGSFAVFLPHPSGLCRAWNEPGAFERAREVLRKAGLPVGAADSSGAP